MNLLLPSLAPSLLCLVALPVVDRLRELFTLRRPGKFSISSQFGNHNRNFFSLCSLPLLNIQETYLLWPRGVHTPPSCFTLHFTRTLPTSNLADEQVRAIVSLRSQIWRPICWGKQQGRQLRTLERDKHLCLLIHTILRNKIYLIYLIHYKYTN
jgi:hypothetical protein